MKNSPKTILVVDDSEIIRTQIKQCFKNELKDIHLAKNGKEALEKAIIVKPDIVTMDLTMPQMDGIECISKLMDIDSDMRILVISALSDNSTCLDALKRGAQGFLDKPFTEDELVSAIQLLLED